jgi:fucose permease
MVTTALFGVFFLALPSSRVLEKTGIEGGMALALVVIFVGIFMFGYFSTQGNYCLSLNCLFIIGQYKAPQGR